MSRPSKDDRDLERHKKHLVEVPREVNIARLQRFRLRDDIFSTTPPLICILDDIIADFVRYKVHIHPLDPVSIFDLKDWVGVPNEVALKQQRSLELRSTREQQVPMHRLPARKRFDFEKLDQEERVAVRQMAENLLLGYVDEERIKRPPYSGVVEYMLERARGNLKAFVAPDLIVCPGDTVSFTGFSTLIFNNVIVYGNGRIRLGNNTKLHAYHIKHVP
ncbi:MAG TPA: hypothetical protein VF952_18150 [Chloroflexia bacterium]|jgi:hypothetical protein